MIRFPRALLFGLLASAAAVPANAQQPVQTPTTPPAEQEPEAIDVPAEGEPGEIVVVGTRLRGQVAGDIPPETQLDEQDVQAYGAGSISELLDALAPLTQSGRGRGGGRPVILLNGRRISGFSEVRDLPPEAIERVDILPEEVALKYGYRADQRVVNFVLKENFNAITTELEGGFATAGGRGTYEVDANILRINRDRRWNLDAEYQHQSPLFESERDIIQANPDPLLDLGDFRTLLAERDQFSLNGTISQPIFTDTNATLNARLDRDFSQAFTGLAPGGTQALGRENDSTTGHLGVALNGDIRPWRWSFTGNFDRTSSDTLVETGGAPDTAETITQVANAELVASGTVFDLPAGDVSTTFRIGAEHQGLRGESLRSGIAQSRELSRGRGNFQANLDVPIASRRRDVLSAIGDLSLNFNGEVEQLSDFGTLWTIGGGINWSPIEEVRVIASVTDEDGAPTMQQLGDPTILAPSVRVFDFTRGETVDISRLEGGNPDLLADNRRVMKLGLTVRPWQGEDVTLRADYNASRINNPIASFPTATPEIEAAFPERFTRDAEGRLLRIDSRPINFARSDRKDLRWGINYSKPLGPEPRRGQGGARTGGAGAGSAGAGAGGRGFGGFGRGGGRGGAGRLQLGLFHTWRFQDEILIRDGVAILDLLEGSAVGGRGGQPRHQVELRTGVFKKGLGARFSLDWQSGTTVMGGPDGRGGESGDLFFSDFITANLRLFANLDQQKSLLQDYPWLKGTRITFAVDNLFDNRLRVRDEFGTTPISYQPDLLDPLGRSVRIGIRKQF